MDKALTRDDGSPVKNLGQLGVKCARHAAPRSPPGQRCGVSGNATDSVFDGYDIGDQADLEDAVEES